MGIDQNCLATALNNGGTCEGADLFERKILRNFVTYKSKCTCQPLPGGSTAVKQLCLNGFLREPTPDRRTLASINVTLKVKPNESMSKHLTLSVALRLDGSYVHIIISYYNIHSIASY